MKHIKAIMKKNMMLIRRCKKNHASDPEKNEGIMWLTDNFHVIEKNYGIFLKALKENKQIIISSDAIKTCKELCNNGILPDTKSIIAFLLKKNISERELAILHNTLIFTLTDTIAMSLNTNDDVLANAVKSILQLPDIDFGEILYQVSETEKLLCQDPTGIYRNMSEHTKTAYRYSVSKIAENRGISETDAAIEILEKAKNENTHIGFFLDIKKNRKHIGKILIATEAIIPFVFSILIGILTKNIYLPFLLYLPVWEAFKFITDVIFAHTTASAMIPSMDFSSGIPDNEKTVIAISTLLPSAGNTKDLCENIKNLYFSNCRDSTCICILADLKSSPTPIRESDNADIKSLLRVIDSMNNKYDNKIILAVRKRIFSETENEYTGYERKRGAIISLAKLIEDGKNDFYILHGDREKLADTKYIMALDSDTKMPLGSLCELVAIAAHPLNRPVISINKQRVTDGYGIISPRVETDVKSACKTYFSSVFAGNGGLPAYSSAVREKYMEFFSESIFSGKGLIDIKTFNALIPDRFPEQRILSHDIPEGIILRTAFAGNVTLTDSFPSNETAFFKRLHRWIRGDIQNLPFILGTKKYLPSGKLTNLGKYWLFDNIRRSATPVFSTTSLLLSVFMPQTAAMVTASIAILSFAMPHLFSCFLTLINGGISMFSRLHFSDAMPYALNCLAKAIVSVITMITHAVCCADAIFRSIFRLIFSKKHLLEWTTAADSNSGTAITFMKHSLPSFFAGVFLILYGNLLAKIAGILIFLDIPFSVLSAKKRPVQKIEITYDEKNELLSYCASMWRFYETHCNKKNNYLIPDNVQETPVYREADRTSPTNIGMMLCSFLAARDFDFIDSKELFNMLIKSFDTIDKLEKYKGHLYNWYNTQKLEIMNPKFISTVDSGNFLCCIVALASGLESYTAENSDLWMIIEKCNKIINECDLNFLYDKRRKLFRIGYDTDKNEFTANYFDLLMSEARMTSYFAVSSGKVPATHWQALGRNLSKNGRYTGPVSWSGTMFEYFMPAIFIPSEKNTLGYEALKFCIHCQKKRVKNMNIPYGISESGYYAFDPMLNYCYKAHGVNSLAMKNSAEDETVISPYSTFLMLAYDPHSAINNLQKLKKLGMYGKFGFYEAIDFTPSRSDNQDYSIVRSYMAHHLGMSFLSAANAVFNGIMQKRFMQNNYMAGGESLLYERIPTDMKVYKNSESVPAPKRPERIQKIRNEYSGISPLSYESHTLSNGEWSVFLTDSGQAVSVYGSTGIFMQRSSPLFEPDGLFAAIKTSQNNVLPFTVTPVGNKNDNFSVIRNTTSAIYKNNDQELSLKETVAVHPFLPAQIHNFSIKNKTKEKKQFELLIYCEPFLENINEHASHPAFAKLFINIENHNDEKLITVTRKQQNKENQIYISFGFLDKSDFTISTDREAVIPRNTGIKGIFSNNIDFSSSSVDKCIFLKIPLTIAPKGTLSKTLLICGSADINESINNMALIRKQGVPSFSKCALTLFDKTSITGIYAKKVIERTFFGRPFSNETLTATKKNTLSRNALWKTGVSGDFPIILVFADNNTFTDTAPFIKLYRKLRFSGIITELIFITESTDGYLDNFTQEIRKLCGTNLSDVIRKRGGIFITDRNSLSEDEITLLVSSATAIYPEKSDEMIPSDMFPESFLSCDKIKNIDNTFSAGGYVIGKTPFLPWCHVIANKNFGTLVCDSSLGFSWALNSRENKLTPWSNNTRESFGGEMLFLEANGKRFDIIKNSVSFFRNSKAHYFSSAENLIIKTTVNVKGENLCKNINIEILNDTETEKQISIFYFVRPILGDIEKNARFIKTAEKQDKVFAHNPYNSAFDGFLCVSSDEKCDFTFDKNAFICKKKPNELTNDCIIAERKIALSPKKENKIKFYLSYGTNPSAAAKMPYIPPKKLNTNKIEIETPDKMMNNIFNDFLQHQIIIGRIYARTGFYQCSGAFGFRDQLQDAMSVILTHPEILQTHIFRCAAAQFREGDVLHWFHQLVIDGKRILRGVRTRYSDDLLWLPLAVSEYCLKTGDTSILNVSIPYIDSPVLENSEKERFGEFRLSDKKETVYHHCLRAINHACTFGIHNLPLIKGGDWNDSFNAVGSEGKGESVWLAMFLSYVAKKFVSIALISRDRKTADKLTNLSAKLIYAIDTHAWDNDRYLRCFYDDGSPMGKQGNKECEIDLLPQAWSAIIGMPDKNRSRTALQTADKLLYDKDNSLIKLFTPPFTTEGKIAGYVNRYPEGIRENGGQYTHGAIWLADAYFSLSDGNMGYEMLKILNPANKDPLIYKTEPYYLAGDVYSGKNLEGRGGWSIYTGSAGWFYRTVYEKMLGITQTNGLIITNPCLPEGFEGSRVKITIDGNTRVFVLE